MRMSAAKETEYNGTLFRSRLDPRGTDRDRNFINAVRDSIRKGR